MGAGGVRREGWELTLAEYLRAAGVLAFAWGEHDCALWASGFIDAVTGTDHAEGWRGLYATQEEADALMTERGFYSVEAIADSILTAKPVWLARRGDCMLHPQGALGLCDGRRSYFLTERGLIAHPTRQCVKAWEV